jgi:monofunctional biosynthetic peptidoglycan transglycosylase
MLIRNAQQIINGEPLKLTKTWKSLDEISSQLQLAVVASEDNRFLEHSGFDLEAIKKAQDYNDREKGKKVRGASTISQQTAKNVFLWPDRNWVRKGLEVYFTFLIETIWGKKRIMEVYLNVIEMGNGIYGAEAASQKYFHRPASALTRDQAALIAGALPNPLKADPAHPSAYLQSRKQWILWNMANIGEMAKW